MLTGQHIAIIGAGNMAEAIVTGLLKKKTVSPRDIIVTDVDSRRLKHFQATFDVRVGRENHKAAQSAAVTLLAVKPQVMGHVLSGLRGASRAGHFVITVAAGISIATIRAGLSPHVRVVRAMPNTASLVLEGATALARGPGVTEEQMLMAHAVFEAVGHVVVVDESHLDAVTGLSGGGVAYVYAFIEALADGGVNMGLSRAHAHLLATQTVLGAARMVQETQEHPGVLKDRVASPGGTTIAGLHQLEKGALRGTVISAVESATVRCKALGQQACGSTSSSSASPSVKRAASRR